MERKGFVSKVLAKAQRAFGFINTKPSNLTANAKEGDRMLMISGDKEIVYTRKEGLWHKAERQLPLTSI